MKNWGPCQILAFLPRNQKFSTEFSIQGPRSLAVMSEDIQWEEYGEYCSRASENFSHA